MHESPPNLPGEKGLTAKHIERCKRLTDAASQAGGNVDEDGGWESMARLFGVDAAVLALRLAHCVVAGAVLGADEEAKRLGMDNGFVLVWEQLTCPAAGEGTWLKKLLKLAGVAVERNATGLAPDTASAEEFLEFGKLKDGMAPTVAGTAFELFIANSFEVLKKMGQPYPLGHHNYLVEHVIMSGKMPAGNAFSRFAAAGHAAFEGGKRRHLSSEIQDTTRHGRGWRCSR